MKFTCYMLIFNFLIPIKHEQYTAGSVNHLILSIRIYWQTFNSQEKIALDLLVIKVIQTV